MFQTKSRIAALSIGNLLNVKCVLLEPFCISDRFSVSTTQKVTCSHSGSPLILNLSIKSKTEQLAVSGCWTRTYVTHWSTPRSISYIDRKYSGLFTQNNRGGRGRGARMWEKAVNALQAPYFDGFIYLTLSTTLIHTCHAGVHAPFTKPTASYTNRRLSCVHTAA